MQILKMFSRGEAEDEEDIELSFQELLQSSPYICIAVGALSACLTFAVLISMYIPAERSGYPNVYAGKRKMVTERACQTGGWCDRSSLTRDFRLRKLRSTSYGPRRDQGKADVYNGDGVEEYPSSELFPVKYKSNRVSDIGSANIIHNVCDCFPESAHHHKLASIMSSNRKHPQLLMHSALGVLNQRHKYLAGKRLPQGSLAYARDIKYPVQTAHGKISHGAGNLPKQYKYLKHNDSYLTMTNPTLSKSQRQRSASRPPGNRLSLILSSNAVNSPEVNTARWLCCFGNQDPSNQLDNTSEEDSKINYSSDNNGKDGSKINYSSDNNGKDGSKKKYSSDNIGKNGSKIKYSSENIGKDGSKIKYSSDNIGKDVSKIKYWSDNIGKNGSKIKYSSDNIGKDGSKIKYSSDNNGKDGSKIKYSSDNIGKDGSKIKYSSDNIGKELSKRKYSSDNNGKDGSKIKYSSDNIGKDGSKRKYSSDNTGDDKRKRKYPHRQRRKKTICQNKLNRSGVTNHAENYAMLHERNTVGASWKNCARFCGPTLAPGKINKPLVSASSSNNVSSRIFNSEGSSNDQSQSRSLADISSDGESFTFSYAEQQSHSDLPGLTASHRLGKDRMLPSQKLSKPGIFTSLPPEVRKPPCGHSKEHKPRKSRRQRKRSYVMQTDDVWETDDFSCSEQFGNSANALLCTSPGEAGENTRSSMVEPRRRTQEATTNQRITYRQCSAAREFHQKVPTFTLHAAGPKDRHAKISSNQECGQGYREGCLQEKSIMNPSSKTEASSSTLVKLVNCSDELRSLMKATIMDLQKYKCSQLTAIGKFPSLAEELSIGSRVGTEHNFSRSQSRSKKHFGNQKGKDNSNSYPHNFTDCRDQNCTNEFNRSHQILQDNSEPLFSGNTSLGRRAGNDQLFSRVQSRDRHVGGQAEQEHSMCHAQDTSIKDCSCNSKFSRSNQMYEDKSVQIHNTEAEATETSIFISSLRQKKQIMAQLLDTSKEKSEESRKHGTGTKAERTVKNTAKQPRKKEKQRIGHKEDTSREEFLSEQCYIKGSEHIVTMKDQDIQYNCSGNFVTNIKCEGLESSLSYNDDMTGSESKFEKGTQRKQSLERPKSSLIHQEGFDKLEKSEVQKLKPTRHRERADKCNKMQNCESHTVTTCCNKQAIEVTPNKYALNKRLANNNNRLQHENITGTATTAPSRKLIIAHSDCVGMSKECQHGFNCVGASKDTEIGQGKREQKDMNKKCQTQTRRGDQHSNRSVVGECKSVGDDASSSDCISHSSDVSLMTNNSAECADASKQMTLTYSHKSKSTEIQDSQITYVLKGRKTRKDTTTGVNSTIDSKLLTYSPDCVQNCTSSQLQDKSNEINSKKQDKLTKDTFPLHCEEAAVDTCSGSCDLYPNANEYSVVAPATSSQFQIQPCQQHSSMLECHDRNVSHKSEAIYGLQDISHPSWQRERPQGNRHRRKKLHKTTTKTNDKRTYKQKQDGIVLCHFRGKETFPGINNYQGKQLALWNRHSSDTFRSTNKHHRPKEKYLMSKTCKLNITGNKKCSKMVFLRSLPQTSSKSSLVSNSHITATRGQMYGTQISSSSHSRSSSQSIYVAQLITNSSSFDLSGNTYSLQDDVVIKTDGLCRYGYQLSAPTIIATECSRTYKDTSCYPIQYSYRGNGLISGEKKTVEQVNDTSASTLYDMLNMETLPHHLPAHTEYGMGASSWSATRTTVSNEISLTSSDGSDLSIYYECASTQSLLVEQIQNIFQNVKSAKKALQAESMHHNVGKYVRGKQEHSDGTAQLSDSCDDECYCGTARIPDRCTTEHSDGTAQLSDSYNDVCCCGTAQIPDSCTTEHNYGTMPLPKMYKSKLRVGEMQSLASRQLKHSSTSVQPEDYSSFDHSSGTVQAFDSSSPRYSSVKEGASISSSPELRYRAVESLGSSSSVDNSGTVQERDRCNPEASSMLLHDPDRFSHTHMAGINEPLAISSQMMSYKTMRGLAFSSHKHRTEIVEPLVSSSHKNIYKKPQALTRSNSRPHQWSSHIPDNYLGHHCKPSSKTRQRPSTHKRKPLSSPLSPPSIPLNGERVSYMQITSKNGAFKGLRLSELDQRSFPSILKKSHSKSNPIIYVSGDNNLTVERQPFSPSVSHTPLFGSRSSISAASASHFSISERSVWTRSRLAGGDSQCQQEILVQQQGPCEVGSPDLGPKIHGDRQVIKNSHRKSSSTKPAIHPFDPSNNIINTSTQQTDFVKTSKCKKKVNENQIPSYNSASFQTIYKVSTPNKMVKHNIKTKQVQMPRNKQKSKLPILCSKNTKSENRPPSKTHNFEKIKKKVFKTSENLQKASFLSKKCQKMSAKKKGKLTTRKSCKPVELKRSAVKNEIHNLDNLFTKDFILGPNNICGPCLPSNYKYKQTVQQVNVYPKTTHMQSPISTQNPRRQKYLQKNIYKPNAFNKELYTAERTPISIHRKPKAHEYEVFSSENTRVAKNHKSEFNSESCSGKNTQINVYSRPKTCIGEPCMAKNIPDSKVYRSNSKKRELFNSGCKQRHSNRETEECNRESSTSENSQTSIHRRRKTNIGQPYIAGNMQNCKSYKAQRNKREVLKAKYKQVGKNREGEEYNGGLNTVENTETSLRHKHGVHRWDFNAENEQVSKTFKPRVYNGESFTSKNSQIRKYRNTETSNEESHKAKIMKISNTRKRCPNKYMTENRKVLNSNYENLCKLGTLSVGESKDSKTCIDTPSPKVFKGLAVSTVKKANSMMAESPPYLNNLDHKRKSDCKKLTKDQLEDTTSTFSRNPPSRVSRKSISCKPEAVFKHKRSGSLVQSAYKIRQPYTGAHAEEDDDSMVGVTATPSPHCEVNRTGLEQQVQNTWLQQVRKPEQSDRQKMNSRNIWQRPVHRKVISKTLKENVYPLENTSPACPPSGLQKTYRSLDICSPEGQSAVNTVIPTERSLNVSHGLLCSQLHNIRSKTTKDTCFKQKSSLNSPEKYDHTRDLEEIHRQGGAESSGETITRNLSGSTIAYQAGMDKHLKVDPCTPSKQVSALDVNHDTTNPLSVFSVSRQAHDNAHPVRIRRLHKTAPAANDMGEKPMLRESTAATRLMDIRKNLGNDFSKPRNTIRRVTGKFHNKVPHNNKDVKLRGRNSIQEIHSKGFSSKMCETSPSSRYQQNRCSSKFVHEDEEVLAAPDSATSQPCRHTCVKRVQFGNHKHDHLSTANKGPTSQYGNYWRRQDIELKNSLKKGRKGFQKAEQLKPEKYYIVDEPIPNPLLAQVSSSPELHNNADESLPVTEGDNVLDRNVSAEEKTRHRIQTRNNIPKDWNCTNKTIGYDSSNKIQEELMSPIDEMDFLNVTCDTTSHTNSHQNIARASTFKIPNAPHGALRDMALNNSPKNLHFMSKCLDLNSDFNTEDSVFPNTTDDVSASAIFDHDSPIADIIHKHRTCFRRNDSVNSCLQNRKKKTRTQSTNQ